VAGSRRRPPSILLDLYAATRLASALLGRELADLGVPADDFGLLSTIAVLEPVTPTALAAELGLAPTTLSDSIARLVSRGQIRRESNPADGRSYLIVLTDEGLRIAREGSAAVRRAIELLDAELGGDVGDLHEHVRRLKTALQSANQRALTNTEP
jgi:DNA-binding MarR family transcriptional regulator